MAVNSNTLSSHDKGVLPITRMIANMRTLLGIKLSFSFIMMLSVIETTFWWSTTAINIYIFLGAFPSSFFQLASLS